MNCQYFFIERVVNNPRGNIGYSLPNAIENKEMIRDLVSTIEADTELKLLVLADAARPGSHEKTAQDIWAILSQYPIGKALIEQYPGIEKYRISGTPAKGDHLRIEPGHEQEDTPFHKFDSWANSAKRESEETMPSFKEYITNPNKYNPQQTSGAATKTKPIR
jgi:hypothetical protein